MVHASPVVLWKTSRVHVRTATHADGHALDTCVLSQFLLFVTWCTVMSMHVYVVAAVLHATVGMQESDRESSALQDQLSRAQEQVTELQAAAAVSTAAQREHESLVNDLSSVVGQQKMHIQVG